MPENVTQTSHGVSHPDLSRRRNGGVEVVE